MTKRNTPQLLTLVKLRPSQAAAFTEIIEYNNAIVNAPTGWGKSLLQVAIAGARLLANPKHRVIIAIPQNIISKGFVRPTSIELPDGRMIEWSVCLNLCSRQSAKVDALKTFLLAGPGSGLGERALVTSHASLAKAVQGMTAEEMRAAFLETTLIVDEAHHIQASQKSEVNALGELLCALLDQRDSTTRLLLATAFFFRGDRVPILDESHVDMFERYHIPFDEYWASLKHLKSYSYDFVTYGATMWQELEALLEQTQSPTIIYCPPDGRVLHQRKPKHVLVNRIIGLIKKHYSNAVLWTPKMTAVGRKVILDLVDTKHRADKVAFAMQHGDQIAAILTIGMFREGADWVQASRVIDLTPSSSDQDRNQRFGRLIRDCKGKEHVQYYSLFPCFALGTKDEQRQCLTNLFAHFQASLLLENAIHPVKIGPEAKRKRASLNKPEYVDYLGQLDGRMQQLVLKACMEGLINLAAECESRGTTITYRDALACIVEELRQLNVVLHQHELAKQIVVLFKRRYKETAPTTELVNEGFDKVWSVEALEGIRMFSSGVSDADTFEEIRQAISAVFERRWRENYAQVSKMTAPPSSNSAQYWWITHNKVLYSQGKLSQEFIGLLECIPWWKWQQRFDNRWQERYDAIRQLPRQPKAGTKDYAWVRQQRRLQAKGKLSAEKITACESISWWAWETNRDMWSEDYERVKAAGKPKAPSKEYDWAKYQRRRWSEGKLDPDKTRQLEQLPWWSWSG